MTKKINCKFFLKNFCISFDTSKKKVKKICEKKKRLPSCSAEGMMDGRRSE
jgi:hypothetical protein